MARKTEQRTAHCPAKIPCNSIRPDDGDSRLDGLGNKLRGIYSDVLAEGIPDSFEDLLRKLG